MFLHLNNRITIVDVSFPLSFFLKQEPDYMLPERAIGQVYTQGVSRIVYYHGSAIGMNPEWPEGDRMIAKLDDYRAAWEVFNQPAPPRLEEVKASKINQLSRSCQTEIFSGFESSALGEPHRYSSEMEDQYNLLGMQFKALLGENCPYVCTDANDVKMFRMHTPQQMQQVFADGAELKLQLMGKFHTLRATVEAATTTEEVAEINW